MASEVLKVKLHATLSNSEAPKSGIDTKKIAKKSLTALFLETLSKPLYPAHLLPTKRYSL